MTCDRFHLRVHLLGKLKAARDGLLDYEHAFGEADEIEAVERVVSDLQGLLRRARKDRRAA